MTSNTKKRNETKWALICDFDGTITLKDVGDIILTYFKAASRKEIKDSYNLNVDMAKWMKNIFTRLNAAPKEIEKHLLKVILIRKGFKGIVKFCAKNNIPLEIVSGGLDLYSKPLFKKWNLNVKSFFGKAKFTNNGYRISYPYLNGSSLDDFKKARVKFHQRQGRKVIFCGDAMTDLKAAIIADKVYATKKLLNLCKIRNIETSWLRTFSDVEKFIINSNKRQQGN
ncbi:MAG: HAD-IB family phosphatase [Elusimicrobiota bacterium]|nr:HAD-IB family phosphatase [Elusimicrobiota bacterium]